MSDPLTLAPASLQPVPVVQATTPQSDTEAARDFIDRNVTEIRYVSEWGRWLLWNGTRWEADNSRGSAAMRRAQAYAQTLLVEAAAIQHDSARREAVKRALAAGNVGKLEALLSLARHDARIEISQTAVDSGPGLIGCRNGIVDLRTGALLPPDPSRYVTKSVAATFDPQATCPRFEKFVSEIFNGDVSLIEWLWRFAGYSLTGSTREQVFAFLYGHGANGKSTLTETLYHVFGDYAGRAGKNLIARPDRGANNPEHEIAELHGVRFLVGSETAEGERLNETSLKDITGGDTLRGCRKYEHAFEFTSQAKLWMYGNHKPDIRGTDNGIWRRVRLLPFERQFTGSDKDPGLADALRAEADGIFIWLVRGCVAWQQHGLPQPQRVMEAVKTYREASDTLAEFIDEMLVVDPCGTITRQGLYVTYAEWAKREGLRPMSNRVFTARIKDRNLATEGKANGSRLWLGIRHREDQTGTSFAEPATSQPSALCEAEPAGTATT
jgi:putative DNA primase/helicase